ncbi:hypothetical protein BKA62DRAFT_716885 [Auriculariales sp. MPI-PUGE-AT-0066]|nr:hypothetical protein BKA62DRAFT_716885 [Auriculariales sp. MPI-PUGE-AT-0066]
MSNILVPPTQVFSNVPLPDTVVQLQQSVRKLEEAIEIISRTRSVGPKTKQDARLLVVVSRRLISAIVAACARRPGDLHVLAKSHVIVTLENIDDWTKLISERTISSPLKSFKLRQDTASRVNAFIMSVQVLEEMLKIDSNGVAQLLLDPARLLGLSESKPSSDLRALSMHNAICEGFKVVLHGLAKLADHAPWPWNAIPKSIFQLASTVERALGQRQNAQCLADKICERIALLLSVCQNKGRSDTQLDDYVELFLADVQRAIIHLRVVEQLHLAKVVLLANEIDKIIASETQRMEVALQKLQIRFTVNTAYTVQTIAADIAAIHAAVIVPSTKQAAHISVQAKLPARPAFFNGREERLSEIVALICKVDAAKIAVMGPGGIGKTSLAAAVLHDMRVIESIGDNRFFISVEAFHDTDAASTGLAKHLGLEESADPLSAAIAYLQSLPRALLVVDNLETLWFSTHPSARHDTEQFLSRLASIPHLALLVTSRGAIPPSEVQWSNAQSAELAPISLNAARDTFGQIAALPSDPAEKAALDTLLGEIDCVPLAVTLLSRLALRKSSPSDLLRRWQKNRTKLLCDQDHHRLHNVDVSIKLSLDSMKGNGRGVESMQLLAVCSQLPCGLRRPVFAQLMDNFEDIDAAKDLLAEFALVAVGAEGELTMLSPIRHFILENHPMVTRHHNALRQIYFQIAASAPQEPADDFATRSAQFAPEYGNLNSFLLHLINSEEPSKELFDAVQAVSEYAYYTVPSITLRGAFLSRLTAHPIWRSDCLLGLGRTYLTRAEYSLAKENLQAARTLYASLGTRIQEAQCRQLLGKCLQLQDLFEAAETELLAARDGFMQLNHESNAAQCMQELGEMCIQRGEHEQAVVHLTSARDTFRRHGKRLYAAQCTQTLGQVQSSKNDISAAESEFQSALAEFQALGEQLGVAQCTHYLANVRRRQRDFGSAQRLLQTALRAYEELDDRLGLANCHLSFGQLYSGQGQTQKALASFATARNMFERLGNQRWAEICSSEIAQLQPDRKLS